MNIYDEKIKRHLMQKERTEDLIRKNRKIVDRTLNEIEKNYENLEENIDKTNENLKLNNLYRNYSISRFGIINDKKYGSKISKIQNRTIE